MSEDYCTHSYFKSQGCVECPLDKQIADLQSSLSKAQEVNEMLSKRNLELTEKLEVAKVALEFYSNNKKVSWWRTGGDSYGVTCEFDWHSELQYEPFEIAEKALSKLNGESKT